MNCASTLQRLLLGKLSSRKCMPLCVLRHAVSGYIAVWLRILVEVHALKIRTEMLLFLCVHCDIVYSLM